MNYEWINFDWTLCNNVYVKRKGEACLYFIYINTSRWMINNHCIDLNEF